MKQVKIFVVLLPVLLAVLAVPLAAQEGPTHFMATLRGPSEVPSILSPAQGTFDAYLTDEGLQFTLIYEGLPTTVTQAHIHIAQKSVNGAITVFFCGGGGRPACTSPDGTITGTITAEDVLAVAPQDMEAGNFDKLIAAIRQGVTYVNVHTMAHGGGEIRGQIRPVRDE